MSERRRTLRAKLKATNQEERIHKWKDHFKNLLGNSPKVTHKSIKKIIDCQQDTKLAQFMKEKLDVVLTEFQIRKAAGLDEIYHKV